MYADSQIHMASAGSLLPLAVSADDGMFSVACWCIYVMLIGLVTRNTKPRIGLRAILLLGNDLGQVIHPHTYKQYNLVPAAGQ